ncbi:hypothetical protein GBAR_LOCUS5590 [Geodia barretti]|uniref:G-protein coupled receptors family 1 profile domain-containing protein n=1 Tax=Geodia barretti TaxID=519541 RepID=A0AA35RBS7_GEOBA|nr:hypothetical protein GBAR_LOCUS5590 [Geodia barretti]
MFYLNLKTLTCLPQCGVWTPFSSTTTITLGVLYVATAIIGLVAGVGVLVLACLNWKKYFTYPTVLMIYQIIYGIFIMLLGVCQPLLPKDMLCSSPNLLQNIAHRKATIFCQLNGAITMYSFLAILILWLFHCATIFWGVTWPYHYSVEKTSERIKYYHIVAVVSSIILPLVFVVTVQLSGGFVLSLPSSPLCGLITPKIFFYTLILPVDLTLIIGVLLLVSTLWNMANVLYRFSDKTKNYKIRASEVKILILISYFFINTLFILTTLNIVLSSQHKQVLDYFLCERAGMEAQCPKSGLYKLQAEKLTFILSAMSITLFPCVYFVFFLDFRKIYHRCKFKQMT